MRPGAVGDDEVVLVEVGQRRLELNADGQHRFMTVFRIVAAFSVCATLTAYGFAATTGGEHGKSDRKIQQEEDGGDATKLLQTDHPGFRRGVVPVLLLRRPGRRHLPLRQMPHPALNAGSPERTKAPTSRSGPLCFVVRADQARRRSSITDSSCSLMRIAASIACGLSIRSMIHAGSLTMTRQPPASSS